MRKFVWSLYEICLKFVLSIILTALGVVIKKASLTRYPEMWRWRNLKKNVRARTVNLETSGPEERRVHTIVPRICTVLLQTYNRQVLIAKRKIKKFKKRIKEVDVLSISTTCQCVPPSPHARLKTRVHACGRTRSSERNSKKAGCYIWYFADSWVGIESTSLHYSRNCTFRLPKKNNNLSLVSAWIEFRNRSNVIRVFPVL